MADLGSPNPMQRRPTSWQDLAGFSGPFVLPPMPPTLSREAQPATINWQDLRQFAPIDYGAPMQAPAVAQAAPPEMSGAYYRPGRPSDDLVARPLMPQSLDEQADQDRTNAAIDGLIRAFHQGTLVAAAGPALTGAGQIAGAVARAAPRAAAATMAAGGLLAGAGQANEPTPLSTAREQIGRLRARQSDLEAEERRLTGEQQRFAKLNRSDPAAIRQAQEALQAQGLYLRNSRGQPVKPDGIWGEGMALAIETYQDRIAKALATNEKSRATVGRDLEGQQQRLGGLEGGERLRQAEESVGPVQQALRDWGPLVGFGVGGLAGHWTRTRAAHRVAGQSAARADEINQRLLPRPGGRAPRSDARAANVNEFWREGGAGTDVPFRVTQTGRGFARRPNAAEASDLYPAGPARFRGSDYGTMGAGAAEAGVSGVFAHQAHQELTEAQAAVQADPSAINIDRLQRARDAVAFTETLWRAGAGFALGRGLGAWTHPYREARPNVPGAEREVMLLNQLLARDAKKGKAGRRTR